MLITDLYPESTYVLKVGLNQSQDIDVWEYAKKNDYIIVSKDADFSEIGLFRGFPPKVVWIRKGNCSTNEIENILRRDYRLVEELQKNDDAGVLLLY